MDTSVSPGSEGNKHGHKLALALATSMDTSVSPGSEQQDGTSLDDVEVSFTHALPHGGAQNEEVGRPSSLRRSATGELAGVDRLKGAYFRLMGSHALGGVKSERDFSQDALGQTSAKSVDGHQVYLFHDQIASLTKELSQLREEVDVLHLASKRSEERHKEHVKQWSLAQAEVAQETMAVMTQMSEAQEDFAKELADLREALQQEVDKRTAVHEEIGQLSNIFQGICSEFGTLQEKVEGEVRQLSSRFGDLSAEFTKIQTTSHSRFQKGLFESKEELHGSYARLREEVAQAFEDQQADFSRHEDLLRKHTAQIAEHTALLLEEKGLRAASIQEIDLRWSDKIQAISGNQLNSLLQQAAPTGSTLPPNDPLSQSRSTVESLHVVPCASTAGSIVVTPALPSSPSNSRSQSPHSRGFAAAPVRLSGGRVTPMRTSALIGNPKLTPRTASITRSKTTTFSPMVTITPPVPDPLVEGPRIIPLPLDHICSRGPNLLSGVVRQCSMPART